MKKPTRVGICMPCMESMPVGSAVALCQMVVESRNRGITPRIVTGKSSLVEISRHNVVQNCLQNDCEYIFFVDTDMTYPTDLLVKLVERNVDIVCCDASTKSDNARTVCKDLKGEALNHEKIKTGLVEIAAAGTGILLIRAEVFKRMELPHFLVEYDPATGLYQGEDYYFSYKAKNLGYKIWCDMTMSKEIGHVGHKEFKIKC